MIKTLRNQLLVIIITAVPTLTFAQNNSIASTVDSTDVKGQFEKLYKKSTTYEQNKVIQISD